MANEELIRALLESKGMLNRSKICQTIAQEEFDLQHYHLRSLECTEEENPHSTHFAAKKMYNIWDVAAKAIEVNGPTGQNRQLKCQRADDEQDRATTKRRIDEEQTKQAAAFTPTSAADKICKDAGVTPWRSLPKKDVMEKFGLDWAELEDLDVPFESKPNPRNPRWKPMRLYKARDVAKALVKHGRR